jgi:hypothetical protein
MVFSRTEKIVIASCLVLILIVFAIPVAFLVRHYGHPGHYERVRIEAAWVTQTIVMNNGASGVTTTFVPEHDEEIWVCDRCRRGR